MRRRERLPRGRRARVAVCALAALTLGGLAAAEAAGLRVNTTTSMPRGLWRVASVNVPPRRGEVVSVCSPDTPVIREAATRGYIPVGGCPGGTDPLVKPVAAVAGDVVTVAPEGIAVNGAPIANTAQLRTDSAGRPLYPVPAGRYPVAPGEMWLLSGHTPRSFDSRYFGPVPVRNVLGLAHPVWVTR